MPWGILEVHCGALGTAQAFTLPRSCYSLLLGPHLAPAAQHCASTHPPTHHPSYHHALRQTPTPHPRASGRYLEHAEAVLCGCPSNTWERYVVPSVASRAAREQQARDQQQYLRVRSWGGGGEGGHGVAANERARF